MKKVFEGFFFMATCNKRDLMHFLLLFIRSHSFKLVYMEGVCRGLEVYYNKQEMFARKL